MPTEETNKNKSDVKLQTTPIWRNKLTRANVMTAAAVVASLAAVGIWLFPRCPTPIVVREGPSSLSKEESKPHVTRPMLTPESQSVPIEKRIAEVNIGGGEARLFGSNPAIAQVCMEIVNPTSFNAKGATIRFQHFDGDNWLGYLNSWRSCDGRRTWADRDFPPGEKFFALLTSHSREGARNFLNSGGAFYFAARLEWKNPNGKPGCLLRYFEISMIQTGAGPSSKDYFMRLLDDLPNVVTRKNLEISYPCLD